MKRTLALLELSQEVPPETLEKMETFIEQESRIRAGSKFMELGTTIFFVVVLADIAAGVALLFSSSDTQGPILLGACLGASTHYAIARIFKYTRTNREPHEP